VQDTLVVRGDTLRGDTVRGDTRAGALLDNEKFILYNNILFFTQKAIHNINS
jgi:hypothetical protein